jgi:hypothetical protein
MTFLIAKLQNQLGSALLAPIASVNVPGFLEGQSNAKKPQLFTPTKGAVSTEKGRKTRKIMELRQFAQCGKSGCYFALLPRQAPAYTNALQGVLLNLSGRVE